MAYHVVPGQKLYYRASLVWVCLKTRFIILHLRLQFVAFHTLTETHLPNSSWAEPLNTSSIHLFFQHVRNAGPEIAQHVSKCEL
jgi:hypothetical protein